MTALSFRPPQSANWGDLFSEAMALVKAVNAGQKTEAEAGPRLAEIAFRLSSESLGTLEELRLQRLASALWPLRGVLHPFQAIRLGVVSNRTLDFLIDPLRAAGLSHLLLIDPVLAPLSGAAAIAHGRSQPFGDVDAVLVWNDPASLYTDPPLLDADAEEIMIAAGVREIRSIAEGIRAATGAEVFLTTCPPDPALRLAAADMAIPGTKARFIERMNRAVHDGAAQREWAVCDIADLAADLGRHNWFDPLRFAETKAPFKLSLNPVVADTVCQCLAARFGKARRAAVFDLDNTLWGGTIGDDGLEGIHIGEGSAKGEIFLAVQRLALDLKRRGVALAVCSKNEDAFARAPFRDHPDMLLHESDIAVFQATWQDKATGIQAIAQTLHLGLESLAFFDDNPAERARVRQELPFVSVPELPTASPEAYPGLIVASGIFEHMVLQGDDVRRATSYAAEARRAEVRETVGNYDDYLKSLKMSMAIAPFDAIGLPRIAQLISKSNQFNLTTRRHSMQALSGIADDPNFLCWQVRLDDMFSDYGMIAVLIVSTGTHWVIDTWLQSCRVLERGIEHAILNQFVEAAKRAGVPTIFGEYRRTPRNGMVADFYLDLGFEPRAAPHENDGEGMWFSLDVASFDPFDTRIHSRPRLLGDSEQVG